MAINRVRARLRFTNASGMAAWAKANMEVRYTQAIHLNEGLANEELKKNDFIADGASHGMYELDIPLMNEAHAIDAYNTLNAIMSWVVPENPNSEECFLERHTCYHDEGTPSGCVINEIIKK